jgi:peptidoglycan/xylan/chitin deacetylase (PgdA/CDA1 family)
VTWRSLLRRSAEAVLVRLPRKIRAGERLILAYHNVVRPEQVGCGDQSLHLGVDQFLAHLAILRREAEVVPLLDLLETESTTSCRVAITFDDAYASALSLGVSACADAGMPCTVFVAPGLLGQVPAWDRLAARGQWSDADRTAFLWASGGISRAPDAEAGDAALPCRVATEEEIVAAAALPGVTFGNHSMHHPNLAAMTADLAVKELRSAQEWMDRVIPNRVVPVVAYPYGLVPKDASAIVSDSGLRYGLLVAGGWWGAPPAPSPSAMPRWNVPTGVSRAGYAVRLRGRLLDPGSVSAEVA